MRNLIASPSPRYIDDVLEPRKEIPCDQFFAKRYFEGAAYRRIREFYLQHTEYDGYLIIAPDDLVVTKTDYDILNEDTKGGDFPVLSGLCNINQSNLKDNFAASTFHNIEYAQFGYLTEEDIRREGFTPQRPFMLVTWAGFPFTWIRRDVVEQVSFKGRPGGVLENEGCAFDQQFALDIQKLGIPQYIDCRVRMLHMWGAGMADIEKLGRKGFEPYDSLMPMLVGTDIPCPGP